MVAANRVRGDVVGADASVMLGMTERNRQILNQYLSDGLTLQQALDRISNESATRVEQTLGIQSVANPFRPS